MKFIYFSDKDGAYCYRADEISAIQRPFNDDTVIYIQMGSENVVNDYHFSNSEEACITYNDIINQLTH